MQTPGHSGQLCQQVGQQVMKGSADFRRREKLGLLLRNGLGGVLQCRAFSGPLSVLCAPRLTAHSQPQPAWPLEKAGGGGVPCWAVRANMSIRGSVKRLLGKEPLGFPMRFA